MTQSGLRLAIAIEIAEELLDARLLGLMLWIAAVFLCQSGQKVRRAVIVLGGLLGVLRGMQSPQVDANACEVGANGLGVEGRQLLLGRLQLACRFLGPVLQHEDNAEVEPNL